MVKVYTRKSKIPKHAVFVGGGGPSSLPAAKPPAKAKAKAKRKYTKREFYDLSNYSPRARVNIVYRMRQKAGQSNRSIIMDDRNTVADEHLYPYSAWKKLPAYKKRRSDARGFDTEGGRSLGFDSKRVWNHNLRKSRRKK